MSGKEQDEEGKDNVGMMRGREREREREKEKEREGRTNMGHSDIRQMALSAQLCLHYSH